MIFAPLLPPLLIAVVCLIGVVAALRSYGLFSVLRGAARLWPSLAGLLRLAALAILAVMLANPVRELPRAETMPPTLALIVDRSASMTTDDCRDQGQPHRLALAIAAARRLTGALGSSYRIAPYGLDSEGLSAGLPATAAGDTSFEALERCAETPGSRVVLISDGADWSGSEPEPALVRAGVTVHALAVGAVRPVANAALNLRAGSASVEPGQDVALIAEITATPAMRGAQAVLIVHELDSEGSSTSAVLSQRSLVLGESLRIELTAPPGSASQSARLWRAELTVLADELSREDNIAHASAVVAARSRNLGVIEGTAWWDTTFAVRAWRRDRQFAVSVLHRLGSQRRAAGELDLAGLSDATLAKLDLVVLGAGAAKVLDRAASERLAAFVDRGGGLLVLAPGPTALPVIDDLAPLRFGSGRSSGRARAGDASPLLPQLLPAQSEFPIEMANVRELAPQAQMLLGTREAPLLVRRRIGAGFICHANLDGVWRWQLSGASGAGDDVGERFWRQVLRGLSTSARGALRPERSEIALGDELAVWTQADLGEPVVATAPDGSRNVLTPQSAGGAVRLRADQAGLWQFRQGPHAAIVVCRRLLREALAIGRDDARLLRLTRATGGTCGEAAAVEALAARLAAAVAPALAASAARDTIPLITSPLWFALLVACLAAEWWCRRRKLGAV